MDKSTLTRNAIAGTVAGIGLVVGGVALASAQDAPNPHSESNNSAKADGNKHHEGFRGGLRGGGFVDSSALAKALGIDEAKVTAALQNMRKSFKPSRPADGSTDGKADKNTFPRTKPSAEDLKARTSTWTAALAKELGISEAKVTAAFETLKKDAAAERRATFEKRLDSAVKDGKLTAADKASVLKAYDAGVLGWGRGGR